MATLDVKSAGRDEEEADFYRRMENFPCMFNMNVQIRDIQLLYFLATKLREEGEVKHNPPEETVQTLNLLTWIDYKLGFKQEAKQLCKKALSLAKEKNITALGNDAFLMWTAGKQLEAKETLAELEGIKTKEEEFDSLLLDARANQAYCYFRLGGLKNLDNAVQFYKEVIKERPHKYLWKLYLGTIYRRACHADNLTLISQSKKEEHVQGAQKMLGDVAENSCHPTLRGRAYSELAQLHFYIMEDISSATRSCEKAIELIPADSWVLTSCGKMMRSIDVDRAIELLTKAVEVKENNTTAFHHLGLCYEKKVTDEEEVNKKDKEAVDCATASPSKDNIATTDISNSQGDNAEGVLNRKCSLEQKAIESYQSAIKASKGYNVPAIFDLAVLFKKRGNINEALHLFNEITTQKLEHRDYKTTMAKAYEQAGLCLMEMGDKHEKEAKSKFKMAIILSIQTAKDFPELKEFGENMWERFKAYQKNPEGDRFAVHTGKERIELYRALGKYGEVIEVLKKLESCGKEQLDDPDIIKNGLESYLAEKKFTDAYLFLNMVKKPTKDMSTQMSWEKPLQSLALTVELKMAFSQLCENCNSAFIFKSIFKEHFSENGEVTPRGDGTSCAVDVLILFDEDTDSEMAVGLQKTINDEFGIDASINLQSTGDAGVLTEVYTSEIRRHCVIIVLLGETEPSSHFKCALYCLDPWRQGVLVVKTSNAEACIISETLRCHNSVSLENVFRDLNLTKHCRDSAQNHLTEDASDDAVSAKKDSEVLEKRADALLTVFCSLLGTPWPRKDPVY